MDRVPDGKAILKPSTPFEESIGIIEICMVLSPYLDIKDICNLASVTRYMRFYWPVRCRDVLHVLQKMMDFWKWKSIPYGIAQWRSQDTCEYNVFCFIITNNFMWPPKRKDNDYVKICIQCGSSAFLNMSQYFCPYVTCKECYFAKVDCITDEEFMIKCGYLLRQKVGEYCNTQVKRLMEEKNLSLIYPVRIWWNWTRHYSKESFWSTQPFLYQEVGIQLISKALVDANLEADLATYTTQNN